MRPKVSVIIPVYNCEDYIERCIKSICNQSLENIEIIVIDDGSTDKTPTIIKSLIINNNNKIKLIRQNNLGVSNARNRGILESEGEYFTFVDGDDYIDSRMIEELYNLAKDKNVPLVCCNLGKGNYTLVHEERENRIFNCMDGTEYIKKILLGQVPRTACGILFQKNYINFKNLFFNSSLHYGEDFTFTVRALLNVKKIYHLDLPYYLVEERLSSASRKLDINHFQNVIKIEHELKMIFGNLELSLDFTNEFNVYLQTEIINAVEKIIFSINIMKIKIKEINNIKKNKLFIKIMNSKAMSVSEKKIKIKSFLIKLLPSPLLIYLYLFVLKIKSM